MALNPPLPPMAPPPEEWCPSYPCIEAPGLINFIVGIFGGLWTTMSTFGLISFQKDAIHSRLLIRGGQQCTGRITRTYKKRVKNGRHSHRTAYMVSVEFTTLRSLSTSGRLRTERTIVKEVEIGSDEWSHAASGHDFEMCYLPLRPTICARHPPEAISSSVQLWFALVVIPLGPPLGFLFVYFLGRDLTSLLLYVVIVIVFLVAWIGGCFDSVGHGAEIHPDDDDDAPVPSAHTFTSTVVVGEPVDGVSATTTVVPPAIVGGPWSDLTEAQRAAAKVLGYKQRSWDKDKRVAADSKYWHQLTEDQRQAAMVLGYVQGSWDVEA